MLECVTPARKAGANRFKILESKFGKKNCKLGCFVAMGKNEQTEIFNLERTTTLTQDSKYIYSKSY